MQSREREGEELSEIAAFFDLDGTLIDVNSGLMWARHERRLGNISRLEMLRVAVFGIGYRLAIVDVERVYAEAVRRYAGVARAELDQRTRDWFRDEIVSHLRPGAAAAIEHHRRLAHRLVLLTSISGYEAQIATETWNLDAWLANDFPVDDGDRLTGELASPLCYGAGKVVYAERWAAAHGVDISRSWFYTDSYTDMPMLEVVAEPRVVAPDPRLKRVARKRGWPIVRW